MLWAPRVRSGVWGWGDTVARASQSRIPSAIALAVCVRSRRAHEEHRQQKHNPTAPAPTPARLRPTTNAGQHAAGGGSRPTQVHSRRIPPIGVTKAILTID